MARIHSLLGNKTSPEKAAIKIAELAKLNHHGEYEDARYGLRIEIQDLKPISRGVEVLVRAWRGSTQLGFGKDGSVEIERIRIFNPPILLEDPNGDIVREWFDPIDKVQRSRRLREDPIAAIQQDIAHTISLIGKSNRAPVKGKIGNTTSTYHPDPNAESTSVDGHVGHGGVSSLSWAQVHDGVTGEDAGDTGTEIILICDKLGGSGTFYRIYRGIVLFDTSNIPDSDTIDSATLSLCEHPSRPTPSVTYDIRIVQSSPASNTAITTADFDAFTVHDDVATASINVGDLVASTYSDFIFDATGLTWISKTAVTKLGVRYSVDADEDSGHANAPGSTQSHLGFVAADQTGTTQDPKLVIEHSSAATAAQSYNTLLGAGA